MNATLKLRELGQSLWLDNITRELLDAGTLAQYIDEYSLTGLTSNPTIFEHAMQQGGCYDEAIRDKVLAGLSDETLFFELALEDLVRAADLFLPAHEQSGGLDGWVSLEVSPLLAADTTATIRSAAQLHARAARPNLFIKIPGTAAGAAAIEESIFHGVPINVTLLFSREQYLVAAAAYMRGIERRLSAGLDPRVASVASIFVSRWDVQVHDKVPQQLRNRLGIAIARDVYREYQEQLASARWQSLARAGARPQRLLWASTGTKDPDASDTLYVESLVAPDTIDTMPEKTLLAVAAHAAIKEVMPLDGGDAGAVLAAFSRHGVDLAALAANLQREGTESFAKSWKQLLARLSEYSGRVPPPDRRPVAGAH